jgi:hypothetical protein
VVVRVAQVARIGEGERRLSTRPEGSVVAAAGSTYEPPSEELAKRHHAELGKSFGPGLEKRAEHALRFYVTHSREIISVVRRVHPADGPRDDLLPASRV